MIYPKPSIDNAIPVIVSDGIHTPHTRFCWDMTCPCKRDQEALNELRRYYQQGLASENDVHRIYHGRIV